MFACTVCSRSFTRQDNLNRHLNNHSNLSFSCTVCSRSFTRQDNLNRHLNNHKNIPFSCTVCSRSFTRQDNLNRHLNNHNNLTFSCTVCSRSFTRQDNLKRHMNDHNNLKFSRAESTREFMIKSNLATHQKTEHNSIQIAPSIIVPVQHAAPSTSGAGSSEDVNSDDKYHKMLDRVDVKNTVHALSDSDANFFPREIKRDNDDEIIGSGKKFKRMEGVNDGFNIFKSAFDGLCKSNFE
ncbi:Hypothetical protein CINCED_3A013097 [Cinara cedri]|uniref:C2H2-type domain-containing protein n=1 Tax=Cinara cedri TaxID=506608 RepID=A0A5E4MBL8_9HEMI|nr:Hypothetical protein CINCED_3A013097 [Cinara cedri]